MMPQLLTIIAIVSCADIVLGASLVLPTSANCGDHAVLTCTSVNCSVGYRFSRNGSLLYFNGLPVNGTAPGKYSGVVISTSQVQLNITNIQLSDSTTYGCSCGFDKLSATQTLQYHCKAINSTATITNDKKLSITVDRLYPQPSNVVASLTNPYNQLSGTYMCGSSSLLASHYRCTWESTTSLLDSNYGYIITVTTGSEDADVNGTFRIVTPTSPTISNLVNIPNRQVVRGVQDTPLTIQCVSSGGIPAPTLAWYRGNTRTSPLVQSSTSDSVQQLDGTYTVTLTHIFTPQREDDMNTFLCLVFYPGATIEASPNPSPATALLYLDLKPDIVDVSQTSGAVSGGSVILQCTSVNGRPAPNITWSYQNQSLNSTITSSLNQTSDTHTVVSVLQRQVSAADNGQAATCMVSHTTLSAPLNRTVKMDVKFGPSYGSTTISGNMPTPATGTNNMLLNCTSGSSNPASNITWYNGSDFISNVVGYKKWSGDNNGVITSNILTITPTRYMDGDRITCRTDNSYGSDTNYVDLDILYPPLIQPLLDITSTEGQPVSFTCSASSKPPANFTWKKNNTILANGTGTITDNSFSYNIPSVDRNDAGSYHCQASNIIGSSDQKNMHLIVEYPPAVTVSTTLSLPYIVICTADGYPDNYTYHDWVQIWPGYGTLATIPFTGTILNLTDATYEMSGVYVCEASNGVAVYGTNVKFIKGNATVLIKAPPVLTDPSPDGKKVTVAGRLGYNATIEIKYWSNVDESNVKCYKLVGGSRSTFSSCSVMSSDTEVTLPVHSHTVKETGTLAIIKIHISSQDDMTAYDVVVSNNVQGESVLGIIVVPQGPPNASTLLGNFSITPGQVILSVLPGFHGGYNQTLVVQISTDLTTWINNTSVYIGLDNRPTDVTLASLRENTLHYVRVFAYNTAGVNISTVMNFTTSKVPPTTTPSSALIGGVVGTTCVLLVVAVVLVVFWRNRKAGCMFSKKADTRMPAQDADNADSVVECAMYVSAGNAHPDTAKGDVYSTPQKRERADHSANLYAVVSQTKKGFPGIPHVAETTFDTKKTPASNPHPRSMKKVNGDGLIYADLDFANTAKNDVIHGLDDVTFYAQIDLTKTAEPIPDRDMDSPRKKRDE